MKPPHDDSHTPAPKPARWISPWSFDDEWEREYAKPKPRAEPEPFEFNSKPKADLKIPVASPKVSALQPPVREVTKPNFSERSKSFEEFGAFSEIQELEPAPAPPTSPSTESNLARFRPPDLKSPGVKVLNEPQKPKISEPISPPAPPKPTAPQKVESAEPSLPTLTPQRRAAAVPTSAQKRPEPTSSWGSAIILFLGMLGVVMLAWIYLTDVKLGSDEDLRIQTPVDQTPKIAAPERMATFLNAVMKIENIDLARQQVWDWDPIMLDSFVKGNSTSFDNLLDLLEDFDWHPHHATWHSEDLGDHPSWPHVRILLQARAIFLLRHGDEASAFAAAIDIAEMSRRMQELWAWPTFMQRSQEMHMAAVQTMAELLRKTLLNSAQLRTYQDEFMQCEPSDSLLQDAFRGFYIHEKSLLFGEKAGVPLDTLPRGITQERSARLFFKKNETLSLFADVFRQLRNQIVMAPFLNLGPSLPSMAYTKQRRAFSFQPNGAGESYFAERIEPYLDMPTRHTLAKARHNIIVCLFATRRFIADQQRLPAGLSELKPSYVMEIPNDVFSGEPLQYDALNGMIFSIGNDYTSSGGKVTKPALLDPSEPTVEIGIKIAAPAQPNQ